MDYNLKIQKLLLQEKNEPLSQNKLNLVKQAIKIADIQNDIEWGYDLRIALMHTCVGKTKNTEALPAFVWLLDTCDKNPELFDETELLWKYKWMIDSAVRNSNISLDQIYSIIEDFKIRLLRNGYSLRAYYSILIGVGYITENLEVVKQNLLLRDQCAQDSLSESTTHDIYDTLLYLLLTKDIEEALLIEDMWKKKINKSNSKFAIDSCLAELLIRNGKTHEAKRFIDDAEIYFENITQKECYYMITLSSLIYALTITKPEKAYEYFEKYAHWINEGEEYDVYIFGLNTLPLLSLLKANKLLASHLKTNFKKNHDIFNYFYNKTNALAQAFDRRNGNNVCTETLKNNYEL